MKKITTDLLICMNDYERSYPIRIDFAYARGDNSLFGEAIYKSNARLFLYRDLAEIILQAAREIYEACGYQMILYDGLRTLEAQHKMLETQRVKDNPHWLEEPRLLSPPGSGGHPRGMAVDVSLEIEGGELLDMGTDFDFLAENPAPEYNRAHREYPHLSPEVKQNRQILHNAIIGAGYRLLGEGAIEMPVEGLPQEWWDFRAPRKFYEQFEPLSDNDLPEEMRLVL